MVKQSELKNGMIISIDIIKSLKHLYLITDVEKCEMMYLGTRRSNEMFIKQNYLNLKEFSEWNIEIPWLVPKNEKRPNSVFVVTTIVNEGQECEETNYCGTFATREKALKYFNSEKDEWYNKLAERYCNDGESVTTYVIKEDREVEIFADLDMKDRVVITLEEKSIQ